MTCEQRRSAERRSAEGIGSVMVLEVGENVDLEHGRAMPGDGA
jgi:hypothetical protein